MYAASAAPYVTTDHARGRKLVRVGEGQIGQAMKPDGRLAAARAALNDHDAGIARGDEIELARIDERRDLWQVAIQRLTPAGAAPRTPRARHSRVGLVLVCSPPASSYVATS